MDTARVDIDAVPTAPYRTSGVAETSDVWALRRELLHLRALTQLSAPSAEIVSCIGEVGALCPAVDGQIRSLQLAAARLRLSRTLAVVPPLPTDDTVPERLTPARGHDTEVLAAEETLTRCAVMATRTRAYLGCYLAVAAHWLELGDRAVALTVINKALQCVERLRDAVVEAAALAASWQIRSAA